MHAEGYLHLDIKPDNLLVSEHDICKLADFGLSVEDVEVVVVVFFPFSSGSCREKWRTQKMVTVVTCQPRLCGILPISPNPATSSVWQLRLWRWWPDWNCSLLELYSRTSERPSCLQSWNVSLSSIYRNPFPVSGVSVELQSILESMMNPVPSERPSAAQLLDHPFLKHKVAARQEYIDKCQKVVVYLFTILCLLFSGCCFVGLLYVVWWSVVYTLLFQLPDCIYDVPPRVEEDEDEEEPSVPKSSLPSPSVRQEEKPLAPISFNLSDEDEDEDEPLFKR